MQSTYNKNLTAANGIFEITVPDFNKVNPSASENSITEANLNVAVNALASFSANIFALPEAEVTPPCETCHFLYEKTFSAGENTFTANLLNLTKSKMNGGGTIFVKITPKTAASFSASASFTVKLTADRECDFVNRELNTDAYQTFDIGSIGTASVNLRDGSLNFSRNNWSFGGGATAFNLMHIYKGASYDSDEIFSDIHTQAGKGWKTNFHQYLAGNNQNASYVDASGKAHFFDISNGKIYDTSGLGLFLGTVASCKKLSDVNGNEMHFSPQGKLCCINSALGNDLFIGYEASGLNNSSNVNASDIGDSLANTRIAYIQNGNYQATFSYQNDLLSSISYTGSEHSADEVLKFTYIDGRLTKIHKEAQVDGSTVESIQAQFAYTDGRLTGIYGDDYVGLEIVYTADGKVQKVATCSYDGDNSTELTSVAFDYQNGVTFVTDNMGLKFKYTLKQNGDIEKIEEVVSESSLVEVYPDENSNDKIQNASYVGSIKLKDIIKMQNTQDNSVVEIDELTESDVISSLYSLYLNGTTIDFSFNGGRKKVCAIPKDKCKLLDANNNSVVLAQGVFKKESIVKDDSNNNIIKIKTEYSFETQGIKETVTTYAILSSGDSEIKKDVTVTNYKGLLVRSEKDDLTTTYTYDSYGNVTSTQITGADGSVISTQASYSANGESQTSFTDERGKTTNYNYVLPHNVLQKLTYPSGGYEQYTYDAFKEKLTGISAKTASGASLLSQTVSSSKSRVSQAVCGNVTYTFTYNNHGDLTEVKAVNGTNQRTVFSASYDRGNNSYKETISHAIGNGEERCFNKYGNLSYVKHDNQTANFSYQDKNGSFNSKARLKQIEDDFAGTKSVYAVSENERTQIDVTDELTDGRGSWKKEKYLSGDKSITAYTIGGATHIDTTNDKMLYYTENYDGMGKPIEKINISHNSTYSNTVSIEYTKDDLRRITKKERSIPEHGSETVYTYDDTSNAHTFAIKKEKYTDLKGATDERVYTYDNNGNITKIQITETLNNDSNAATIDYTYDAMNRITKEVNQQTGDTIEYAYDANGNITSKTKNNVTINYTYDNAVGDLLTSYGANDTISYTNGYPTTYRGRPMEWSRGLLKSFTNQYSTQFQFTYDVYGRRTKAQYGTMQTSYFFYEGDRLIAELMYTGSSSTPTMKVHYLYDNEGVCACKIFYQGTNNNNYAYYNVTRDILGNVIRLDGEEGCVLKIKYTAFGEPIYETGATLKVGIPNFNQPQNYFRLAYKGYFYDQDLKLYYLMSRYYDPETGRFISPDSIDYLDPETLGGLNLYAYCNNNPINYYDPTGHFALTTFGILAIIGIISASMILGGGLQLASNALAGKTGADLWHGVLGATLGAGVNALALCLIPFSGGTSLAISALIGAAVQTGVDTIENLMRGEDILIGQTILDFGINFATIFAGNWLSTMIIPTNSGWFKPQKFFSVFTKPYGQKILLQTVIGAGLSGIINFIKKSNWNSKEWKIFMPISLV